MRYPVESPTHPEETVLPEDFTQRLEAALRAADHNRRRRSILRRAGSVLPVILLLAPILGWRLMLATPDAVHVSIAALAWLTFLLDVGVHVDTAVLSYLGLRALPTLLGGLLLVLVTVGLLTIPQEDK
jgi:hypothetical protein